MPQKRKSTVLPSNSQVSPSAKRKRNDDVESTKSRSSPSNRSEKTSHGGSSAQRRQPKSDPVFGQRFALPGLEEGSDDGSLSYGGEPADGLEYLRSVRSEARRLPSVLNGKTTKAARGPHRESFRNAPDTHRAHAAPDHDGGTFYDGIWVAPPPKHTQTQPDGDEADYEEELDAQEQCYASLCSRFTTLRTMLAATPPAEVIQALGDGYPIYLPRHNRNARREWKRLMANKGPRMAQVACFDMESVLGVLHIAADTMPKIIESGDVPAVMRLGAWIWGALGRCRPVGQLSSEEVSQIRDLAKVARDMLDWVKDWEQHGGEDYGDEGNAQDGDAEIESDLESIYLPDDLRNQVHKSETAASADAGALQAAKAQLQARLAASQDEKDQPEVGGGGDDDDHDPDYRGNTEDNDEQDDTEWSYASRAMIDMILTIAGECFGQRDLLEARDIWDEQ